MYKSSLKEEDNQQRHLSAAAAHHHPSSHLRSERHHSMLTCIGDLEIKADHHTPPHLTLRSRIKKEKYRKESPLACCSDSSERSERAAAR